MDDRQIMSGKSASRSAVAKMSRARQLQADHFKNDKSMSEEIKELEARRRQLQTSQKLKRGQYKEWLSDAYQSSIIPFSQAWNLQFAASMHAKLPPELREMVYNYLLDPETRNRPIVRAVMGAEGIADPVRNSQHEDINIPHFMCSDYVGVPVAFEVVQALYRRVTDVADMVIDTPRNIFDALFTDRFFVGLRAFSILRAVSIHCLLDRYRTPPMRHPLTNQCKHTWQEHVYLQQAELKAQFQQLLIIEKKKDFKLHITLMQRNERIGIVAEALLVLRSTYRQLIDEGAEVSLAWAYCPDYLVEQDLMRTSKSLQTDLDPYISSGQYELELWEGHFKKWLMKRKGLIPDKHFWVEDEPAHYPANTFNTLAHRRWADGEREDWSWDRDVEYSSNGDEMFEEDGSRTSGSDFDD